MARVLVVEDGDVPRQLPERRLSGAGHRVRTAGSAKEARVALRRGRPGVLVSDMHLPVVFLSGRALPGDGAAGAAFGTAHLTRPASLDALDRAIDAAIEASPPALMSAVRTRLGRLGADDGEEERAVLGRLLDVFVDAAPDVLAAVEAALGSGDDAALEAGLARLGGSAAHLGAAPLARLCADLEDRVRSGEVPPATAVRAALRRELTVTCRVLRAVSAELGTVPPPDRRIASAG